MSTFDNTQVQEEWHGIQVNIGNNNNKFWSGYLLKNGEVWAQWGRVGESVEPKKISVIGLSGFTKKVNDKKKGKPSKGEAGYVESNTIKLDSVSTSTTVIKQDNLAQVATQQISAKSKDAIELIRKLCEANVHQILDSTTLTYNAQTGMFSTPLGIVTQSALDEARNTLVQIGSLVQSADWNNPLFSRYNNQFFQLVPQDLGRRRVSCEDLWSDMNKVKERNELLDNLEASLKIALTPADNGDTKTVEEKKMFDANLDLIEDGKEMDRLNKLFLATLNRSHVAANLKLNRAFTVSIGGMQKDFIERGLTQFKDGNGNPNVRELWHGTGTGNIISILKTGFKVSPPSTAKIAGKMFGNGLYFAIQSTKSLNYAYGVWHGSTRNKTCYMFLNDIAMGNWKVPTGSTSSRPPHGYHTWWAQPGKSGIANDEIIVFDEAQVNPRYILEFTEVR